MLLSVGLARARVLLCCFWLGSRVCVVLVLVLVRCVCWFGVVFVVIACFVFCCRVCGLLLVCRWFVFGLVVV